MEARMCLYSSAACTSPHTDSQHTAPSNALIILHSHLQSNLPLSQEITQVERASIHQRDLGDSILKACACSGCGLLWGGACDELKTRCRTAGRVLRVHVYELRACSSRLCWDKRRFLTSKLIPLVKPAKTKEALPQPKHQNNQWSSSLLLRAHVSTFKRESKE